MPLSPPGSRWSSTSTRTPSRSGSSCFSSKTRDPVSGAPVGGGPAAGGGAMSVSGGHRAGWEGPWSQLQATFPQWEMGPGNCGDPAPVLDTRLGLGPSYPHPARFPGPLRATPLLPRQVPSTCFPSRTLATSDPSWDAGWGMQVVPPGLSPSVCPPDPHPPVPRSEWRGEPSAPPSVRRDRDGGSQRLAQ